MANDEQPTPKRGRGRPPGQAGTAQIDTEKLAQIVGDLREGNYLETAIARAGLAARTVREWMALGKRDPGGPYGHVAHAIDRAMADAEHSELSSINAAERDGVWQAAAWKLERRGARRWAPKVYVQVEQELTAYLQHLRASLDEETYARVLQATADFGGPGETAASMVAESTAETH